MINKYLITDNAPYKILMRFMVGAVFQSEGIQSSVTCRSGLKFHALQFQALLTQTLCASSGQIKTLNKFILIGLFLLTFKTTTGQDINSDDYQIYSRVLNAFLRDEKVKGRKIVLESDSENEIEINPYSMWDSTIAKVSYKLDSVNQDKITFDKFQLKNYQLVIVNEDNLNELFKDNIEDGWTSFYKKYSNSGGIVRMSKMFLSSNRAWGLIYISISKGGLDGAGYLIKFDLQDKKIIITKERLWIS